MLKECTEREELVEFCVENCFENYLKIDGTKSWRNLAYCVAFGELKEEETHGVKFVSCGNFVGADRLLDGWGVQFSPSRITSFHAIGYFKRNMLEGSGSFWTSRWDVCWGTFKKNSLVSGFKSYRGDKWSYEGEYDKDEVYHGKMTWRNGFSYEGAWRDGRPVGLKSFFFSRRRDQ